MLVSSTSIVKPRALVDNSLFYILVMLMSLARSCKREVLFTVAYQRAASGLLVQKSRVAVGLLAQQLGELGIHIVVPVSAALAQQASRWSLAPKTSQSHEARSIMKPFSTCVRHECL